jgi:hypothetical protein
MPSCAKVRRVEDSVKPMIFASRNRRRRDRYVTWKTVALFVGAGAVLLGGRLGLSLVTWIGIGILAAGFALRFAPQAATDRDDAA